MGCLKSKGSFCFKGMAASLGTMILMPIILGSDKKFLPDIWQPAFIVSGIFGAIFTVAFIICLVEDA